MGRKPLPLGSWGLIRTDAVSGSATKRFRARAYYRDFDGITRLVEASGKTATQASQALRTKLQNRSQAGGRGELTSMSRFSDAAAVWVERVDSLVADGRRSPSTAEIYRRQLRLHVLPAMGELRLGEITTPLVDRVISGIKSTVSPSTAKTARSVISGVMGQAVRHGAALANPVREVERIESTTRRPPRALEAAERVELLTWLARDEKAGRHDLPELVFFMLATGVRIGEALATVWSEVDFGVGTVHVTSTLVRVRGEGLLRKSTKTSSGDRLLDLPASALAVLQRRFMSGARLDQPLFPDVVGGFRDPSNVRRELREAREAAGMPWVTSHTFRKTAATILDEAALSARLIADQLGHSRISMTQDVYLARRSVGSPAALALDDRLRDIAPLGENDGKTMGNDKGQAPGGT